MKRTTYTADFRAKAVKLAKGVGVSQAAKQLNIPEGTLREWVRYAKKGENTKTNSPFSRPGNKNAAGNKGGIGAVINNKYALKTGEHERILFDDLTDDERTLMKLDYTDKYTLQVIQLKTLTIRQYRIWNRIYEVLAIYDADFNAVILDNVATQNGTTTTAYTNRNKSGEEWDGNKITETVDNTAETSRAAFHRWMDLEAALSRVLAQKQRAIESLHKMEMEAARLSLDTQLHELKKMILVGMVDLDTITGWDNLDLAL